MKRNKQRADIVHAQGTVGGSSVTVGLAQASPLITSLDIIAHGQSWWQ